MTQCPACGARPTRKNTMRTYNLSFRNALSSIAYCTYCVLWAFALAACTDSDPSLGSHIEPAIDIDAATSGGSCELQPCGGDILGKWTIASSCMSSTSFPGCDDGKIDVSDAVMRGTMEFLADGTYITTVGAVGSMTMKMPASCLMGATCEGLEASLGAQTGDDFAAISCQGTEVCNCKMEGQSQRKVGTYTLYGNVVVASAPDSKGGEHTDMFDFCVEHGKLRLATAAGTPSPVLMSLSMIKSPPIP